MNPLIKFLIGSMPKRPTGKTLEAFKSGLRFVEKWASPENEKNVIERFMRTHRATGMTEPMNLPGLKQQLADMRQKVSGISDVHLINPVMADTMAGARRGKTMWGMYTPDTGEIVMKEGLSPEAAYGVAVHEGAHAWNVGILANPMEGSLFHPGYQQLAEEVLGLPRLKMTEDQVERFVEKGMNLAQDQSPRGLKRLAAHQKKEGKLSSIHYLSLPHEIHSRTMAARAFLPWEKVAEGTVTPDDVMNAYRNLNQRDPDAAGFAFRYMTDKPNKNHYQGIFTPEHAARFAKWQNITPTAAGLGLIGYLSSGGDA